MDSDDDDEYDGYSDDDDAGVTKAAGSWPDVDSDDAYDEYFKVSEDEGTYMQDPKIPLREKLGKAAERGKVKQVKEILKDNPSLNVNWRGKDGKTPLHLACEGDKKHCHEVVPLLLAHPDINVNEKDDHGATPFWRACWSGSSRCARTMLADTRVDVLSPDKVGFTALWYTAEFGYPEVVRTWIASGREMDLGQPGNRTTDALGNALHNGPWDERKTVKNRKKVVLLLQMFKDNPVRARHKARYSLNYFIEMVAEFFVPMVFVSEGLLRIRPDQASSPAASFFRITSRLPVEVQMRVAHLIFRSVKWIIPQKNIDMAFRELAQSLPK